MKRTYAGKLYDATKRRRVGGMMIAAPFIPPRQRPVLALRTVRRAPSRGFVNRTPGGQITADNHYFDTERSITAVPSVVGSWAGTEMDPNTTAMLSLFNPVTGDDISNRTGRKVYVKKIRIQGQITQLAQSVQPAADDPAVIRMIVFQDMQTNASNAGVAQQLIQSGNGTDAIHMFQSTATFGRFRVLKDKTIILQNPAIFGPSTGSLIGQNGLVRNFKMSIKINQWVNYNATNGGTVADTIDNSFHMIINSTLGGNLAPFITYKTRTVFLP